MVESVKEFRAELQLHRFAHGNEFADANVPIVSPRPR